MKELSKKKTDELAKLEKLKWKLAKDMDDAQTLTESAFILMQFQEVLMKIYYLESEKQGLNKTEAKKQIEEIFSRHNMPIPTEREKK